jgi:hypothetical protein
VRRAHADLAEAELDPPSEAAASRRAAAEEVPAGGDREQDYALGRILTISDAIFAFALTLLVVNLVIPAAGGAFVGVISARRGRELPQLLHPLCGRGRWAEALIAAGRHDNCRPRNVA